MSKKKKRTEEDWQDVGLIDTVRQMRRAQSLFDAGLNPDDELLSYHLDDDGEGGENL